MGAIFAAVNQNYKIMGNLFLCFIIVVALVNLMGGYSESIN